MLALARAGRGDRLTTRYSANGANLTAYAVRKKSGEVALTIVNKERGLDAAIQVAVNRHALSRASLIRLTGPSLESRQGVQLGGSSIDALGKWEAARLEQARIKEGACEIDVPRASAAIVTLNL